MEQQKIAYLQWKLEHLIGKMSASCPELDSAPRRFIDAFGFLTKANDELIALARENYEFTINKTHTQLTTND